MAATNINTKTFRVTSTPAKALDSRTGRITLFLRPGTGKNQILVGNSGVTLASGYALPDSPDQDVTAPVTEAEIWAVSQTPRDLYILETW
jgi:hypothetical protein